jgi:hypothetical protein
MSRKAEKICSWPIIGSMVEDGLWTGVLVMEMERLARGDTHRSGHRFSGVQIQRDQDHYPDEDI